MAVDSAIQIKAEATDDPEVFQFTLNRPLLAGGSVYYTSADVAGGYYTGLGKGT